MESKVGCDGDMDSLRATELRLGPPGENEPQKPSASRSSKRALAAGEQEKEEESSSSACARPDQNGAKEEAAPPPAKAQVVGWPPIRSFRKNCLQAAAKMTSTEADAPAGGGGGGGVYVKVSMDGAPYLRKVDLRSYGGYRELRQAMEAMFKCFSTGTVEGRCSSSGSSSDYVVTYEDKDGDWMLAGDVPWEMFACSCRRLRIMRGSDARGLGSSRT